MQPQSGAYTIDDTPDHTTLYVATVFGDVYRVDPVAMTVVNRFLASEIGPSGYPSGTALVMADGRVALLGGTGGVGLDGTGWPALWNPAISYYRIAEKRGGGGMDVVYKAEDIKLDPLRQPQVPAR